MTDAERAIWFALRDRWLDGFKFRRQVTLGRCIVDFCCAEAALVVEVDGGQHDDAADTARTAMIKAVGYRVIRFWNNDVLTNFNGVMQTLHALLLPAPSPAGGRGPG